MHTRRSDFIMPILQPNTKEACIFPIFKIFPQPEEFLEIYSKIQKAQAV